MPGFDFGWIAIVVLLMLLVMCLVTVLTLASSLEVVGGSHCCQAAGVYKTRSVNVISAVISAVISCVISICWPRGVYKFYSCIYNI